MKDTIRLDQYSLKHGQLPNKLFELLGDELYTADNWQELLYRCLTLIAPVNKGLRKTSDSIRKACATIVAHYGLKNKVTVRRLTNQKLVNNKPVNLDDVTVFKSQILALRDLPFRTLKQITSEVRADLENMTRLIDKYEQRPEIVAYLKKNEAPKKHEERMIFDFYQRCLKERVTILDYYLKGMRERALQKSRVNLFSFNNTFLESLLDRPYSSARPFAFAYFDVDLLDQVGHRISEISYDSDEKMEKLYKTNKASFYRYYFKKIPVAQHFHSFDWYLAYLPLQKDRKPIFAELKKLFSKKLWIGFYALALPQLEGLFSEMCRAIDPGKDTSEQSLTRKVNTMRPYHSLSDAYFDYYEYFIPLLRNKFAHTGYDEDFKLKSFDVLADLLHLFKIFSELDDPLIKLKHIHTRMDPHQFVSIADFSEYFHLVDSLKQAQKTEIKSGLESFEKEFLVKDCSLDYTISQFYHHLPVVIQEAATWIKTQFGFTRIPVDFDKYLPEIQSILTDPLNLSEAHTILTSPSYDFDKLHSYFIFLKRYKVSLPNLDQSSLVLLNEAYKLHFKKTEKIIKARKAVIQAYDNP